MVPLPLPANKKGIQPLGILTGFLNTQALEKDKYQEREDLKWHMKADRNFCDSRLKNHFSTTQIRMIPISVASKGVYICKLQRTKGAFADDAILRTTTAMSTQLSSNKVRTTLKTLFTGILVCHSQDKGMTGYPFHDAPIYGKRLMKVSQTYYKDYI